MFYVTYFPLLCKNEVTHGYMDINLLYPVKPKDLKSVISLLVSKINTDYSYPFIYFTFIKFSSLFTHFTIFY